MDICTAAAIRGCIISFNVLSYRWPTECISPPKAGEQVIVTSSVSLPIGNASLVPSSAKEKVNASRNLGNKTQPLKSSKGEITHLENQGTLFRFTRILPTAMPTVYESVSPVSTFMKMDSLTTPHQQLLPNQNTSSDLLMVWSHYTAIPQPLMDKIDTFFKLNSERNIVFVCGSNECMDQIDEKLREHARILRLRLPALAKGSPLDDFVSKSAILKLLMGRKFQVLMHEVSVLLSLWTFGGLYIDIQSIKTSKVPAEYFKDEWMGNKSIFSISRFERRSQVIKNAMGVIQSAYSSHNRSQILKWDSDSILWSSKVLNYLKKRKIEVDLRKPVIKSLQGGHYGVLTHDNQTKVINNGDEIQTLAALQFLPFVDRFVDRDTWDITCIDTHKQTDNVDIFVNVTENTRKRKHDNETITIFLNAWYNAGDIIWPPKSNLNPLILSVYFGPNSWKKLFTEPGKNYLKEHGPVGARDQSTFQVLRDKNIPVYMSACLTLLIHNGNSDLKREDVLVVDVDRRAVELIVPYHIRKSAITAIHNLPSSMKFDIIARYEAANHLMEQYSRAKLVLTSRIHFALPCLAMEIPVVFVKTALSPKGERDRTDGLTELFHTVTVDKMMTSYKGMENFNWDKPEINPNREISMRFRDSMWQEIQKFPALRETAITFGRVPLKTGSRFNPNKRPVLTFFQVYTTNEVTRWNRRSLESIFYHHPNAKVRILSNALSQAKVSAFNKAGFHVQVRNYTLRGLLKRIQNLEPRTFTNPSEVFLKRLPVISKGSFWFSHETDLIRIIMLYLYGGVYMDTDVILVKSLQNLYNVTAWENKDHSALNGAVLKFDKHNPFLRECIKEFLDNYQQNVWGANGPLLLTRMAKKYPTWICNVSRAEDAQKEKSCIVRCLYRQSFYPIQFRELKTKCFIENGTFDMQRALLSEAFAVHLFHQFTKSYTKTTKPGTLCRYLLNNFCIFCSDLV
ncbi:uncharacterized protein LOC106160056 [Lingula anatina]|uniref:Uncharacterized protein LOC106160056 n=1 Tax=Lingula anatina TaxID=7574 RepID=A0A2R2MKL3_LINAN|nr:uncharacterized protein LOC106160056 [Lingula anatina]|eukprot:XP_023930745.1 uncharacterized protein LOC106160056 [Lingula anatina]